MKAGIIYLLLFFTFSLTAQRNTWFVAEGGFYFHRITSLDDQSVGYWVRSTGQYGFLCRREVTDHFSIKTGLNRGMISDAFGFKSGFITLTGQSDFFQVPLTFYAEMNILNNRIFAFSGIGLLLNLNGHNPTGSKTGVCESSEEILIEVVENYKSCYFISQGEFGLRLRLFDQLSFSVSAGMDRFLSLLRTYEIEYTDPSGNNSSYIRNNGAGYFHLLFSLSYPINRLPVVIRKGLDDLNEYLLYGNPDD